MDELPIDGIRRIGIETPTLTASGSVGMRRAIFEADSIWAEGNGEHKRPIRPEPKGESDFVGIVRLWRHPIQMALDLGSRPLPLLRASR